MRHRPAHTMHSIAPQPPCVQRAARVASVDGQLHSARYGQPRPQSHGRGGAPDQGARHVREEKGGGVWRQLFGVCTLTEACYHVAEATVGPGRAGAKEIHRTLHAGTRKARTEGSGRRWPPQDAHAEEGAPSAPRARCHARIISARNCTPFSHSRPRHHTMCSVDMGTQGIGGRARDAPSPVIFDQPASRQIAQISARSDICAIFAWGARATHRPHPRTRSTHTHAS